MLLALTRYWEIDLIRVEKWIEWLERKRATGIGLNGCRRLTKYFTRVIDHADASSYNRTA